MFRQNILVKKYFQSQVTVLMHDDIKKFQLETLKFCIPENWNISLIKKNKLYEIDEFIFPSFIHNHMSGYLDHNVIKFIQNKIYNGYKLKKDFKNQHNVYISRGRATKEKF